MTLLTVVVILALLSVIGVLATGVGSMAHGGKFDQKHSTQLMGMRVVFQGLAVALILTALYLALG